MNEELGKVEDEKKVLTILKLVEEGPFLEAMSQLLKVVVQLQKAVESLTIVNMTLRQIMTLL